MLNQSMLDPPKLTPTCRSRNNSTPTSLEKNAWLTTLDTPRWTRKVLTSITWVHRRLLLLRAAKSTTNSDNVPAAMKRSIKTTKLVLRNKDTYLRIYSTGLSAMLDPRTTTHHLQHQPLTTSAEERLRLLSKLSLLRTIQSQATILCLATQKLQTASLKSWSSTYLALDPASTPKTSKRWLE